MTPRSAIVCRHRSQRTGAATWATSRAEQLGAAGDDRAVGVREQARAGGRSAVSPATAALSALRGPAPSPRCGTPRRPRAGGAAPWPGVGSASAASAARGPAATTWPAPLRLAAIEPEPVERRVDLVGVAAEHGGHAGVRGGACRGHRATALAGERKAASGVSAPARAAAGSSPML